MEISFLAESDRACWEALARAFDAHAGVERGDDAYSQTWRSLLGREQPRGIAARLDGEMVGVAHYVFHAGVWNGGRCYLADLFVDAAARRRGVATAMIRWIARDAEDHGFPRLYWNALDDPPARALYEKLGNLNKGFVVYSYRRGSEQNGTGAFHAAGRPEGPLRATPRTAYERPNWRFTHQSGGGGRRQGVAAGSDGNSRTDGGFESILRRRLMGAVDGPPFWIFLAVIAALTLVALLRRRRRRR